MTIDEWAAAFIVAAVVITVAGVAVAAFIRYGNPTDEIEAADWAEWEQENGPPEYQPDEDDGVYADARAEYDMWVRQWWAEQEGTDD